jgi:hypothetical protein
MDVSDIEPGVNFVDAITAAIASCDVLIAVIGSQWLNCTNEDGTRRIDDRHDFVRLEIALSLERNLRVIPVLIRGATMPDPDDLPYDLVELSKRQAVEISDSRWDYDTGRFIRSLERTVAPVAPSRSAGATTSPVGRPARAAFNPDKVSKVDYRTWKWEERLAVGNELAFRAADQILKKLGFTTKDVDYPARITAAKSMTSGWSALLITGGEEVIIELEAISDQETVVSVFSRSKQTNLVDPLATNRKNIQGIAEALIEAVSR